MKPFARAMLALATALLTSTASADLHPIQEGGCIFVPPKDGQPQRLCPLEHTDVAVDIAGFIARVTVTQRFSNPFPDPIEAVYAFPLSERAAVDAMRMEIGDRVIIGRIKRKAEAREIYDRARVAGHTASLLEQQRPNLFTQSVANIPPGQAITVVLSYVEYLDYEDGSYHFDFPMTIGPRYLPAGVPDADKITPPVTPPHVRAGHDIALTLLLDAGVTIHGITSEQHEIETDRIGDTKAVVRLANRKEIPNRDFMLRYSTAGTGIEEAVLTHRKEGDGYFTILLNPPARPTEAEVSPRELIFVIDCSGSMRGFPIEKAKDAMRKCIQSMHPGDRFNLISFAGGTGYCFQKSVDNTPENRAHALNYLAKLEGGGGTEMMGAVRAALARPCDDARLRVVCFMTDAFIGNDMEILDEIRKNADSARVFALGIGSSVNRFLIQGMAREGRGAAEIVTLESDSDAAVKRFYDRIRQPLLTDITVDFGKLPVLDISPDPARIPDLFAAQPLSITGRYTRPGRGEIVVRGSTPAGPYERRITVDLPAHAPDHDVLAQLWARQKIDALMAENWLAVYRGDAQGETAESITKLGLDFGLMTQYTSFVAVEERVVNESGAPRRVEVPIELPDGVSYEGIFGDQATEKVSALGHMPAAPGIAAQPRSTLPTLGNVQPFAKNSYPADAESRTPVSHGVTPVQETFRKESVSVSKKSESSTALRERMDPALHVLLDGARDGVYADGKVNVQDGKVTLYLRLAEINDAILDALRATGAEILTLRAAQRGVLVKMQVDALKGLAYVEGLLRIEVPPV